jgi:hypothetical protein
MLAFLKPGSRALFLHCFVSQGPFSGLEMSDPKVYLSARVGVNRTNGLNFLPSPNPQSTSSPDQIIKNFIHALPWQLIKLI